MAYRIGLVELKNFGPFAESEINLNHPGVTVVEGRIEGVPGCDSNGAGKSFIFDAVAWCLYGRCIRPDYTTDNIIKLGPDDKPVRGGTRVRVTLDGGPESVVVERYRKDPKYNNQLRLIVGGNDVSRGTDAQTELAIERKLGIDFVTFCNSVAFGVREDVKSFFFATDTERKKVLDTLLGLELYAEAEKVAKRKVKELAGELDTLELRLDKAMTRREAKQESLDDTLSDAELSKLDIALKSEKLKLKKIDKKDKPLKEKVEKLQDKQDKLEDTISKQRQEWKRLYEAYEKDKQKTEAERIKCDTAVTFAKSKAKSIEREIEKSDKMAGATCPTCEQDVPKKHVDKMTKLRKDELKQLTKDIKKGEEELAALEEALEALTPPEQVDDSAIHQIEKDIAAVSAERSELRAESRGIKATIEQMEARLEEAKDNKGGLKEEIEKLDGQIAEIGKEIDELNLTLSRYEFWATAYGNKGLKSFLIEAEIPEINRYATKYAQKLLGHGATVRLSATSTLKSGASREKLTVHGAIPGYTKSYSGASKGQKKRMDLSLLLSFRRLVASRADRAIDQVFADEIFDGVDQAGVEAVGELLREEAGNGPVLLVTHDPRLKPVGDRFATVHNVNSTATIVVDTVSIPASKPEAKPKKKLKVARRRKRKTASARGA